MKELLVSSKRKRDVIRWVSKIKHQTLRKHIERNALDLEDIEVFMTLLLTCYKKRKDNQK